ncbi:MAG: type II secretion system protein [Candidatus Pacebacteria bacterium]|jgi:prepilin-type N-terminal cleavage/methylation domain-containing protein|nr:type II secretion system protein [Candidatus Paceibacterota bacterium]
MKNKKGFTLIEMLIVITIIAVLASLILVGMGGARQKSRDSKRVADLHNVMNALELYYSFKGHYPKGTYNSVQSWDTFVNDITKEKLSIGRIPRDPLNTGLYYYRYASNDLGTDYVLGARLEEEDPEAVIFSDDIDGTHYTIDCSDTNQVYCVMP